MTRRALPLYYAAVSLCAIALLFAAVGLRRLVAVIALGGIVLAYTAGMQLREGRRRGPLDRTLEFRLLGLMIVGAGWVLVGVAALVAG